MKFTIGAPTRCPGLNHWHVPVTPEGRPTRVVTFGRDEFAPDPDPEACRADLLVLLRSMAKAAGATSWAQFVVAVAGKDVHL